MELLRSLAFAVACLISINKCAELSAEFDMSIDAQQEINIGFIIKKKVLEPECEKEEHFPAWCPVVGIRTVRFLELPTSKKTFTFSGRKIYKLSVKRQVPPTQISKVKFSCEKDQDISQEVNGGFDIKNADKICLKAAEGDNAINCKISEFGGKNMIVTFTGKCKSRQDFTFTGQDANNENIEMKVEFKPLDPEVTKPTTAESTVTTTTSTTIATDKTTLSNEIGKITSEEIEKDFTTTSIGISCKFPTTTLAIFFLLEVSFMRLCYG